LRERWWNGDGTTSEYPGVTKTLLVLHSIRDLGVAGV